MVFSLLPGSNGRKDKEEARGALRWAALFLGELRDGLTMINMQSAYLIVSKEYSEKQVGILFFVFGMSQFLFQTPAGYLYDYTEKKVLWLSTAAISTTLMTVVTALFAAPAGGNLSLMVLVHFLQGAITSFIPPGLNSITQGIVGASGMTEQVSTNEMMNHLGTAIIVLVGSLIGLALYPDLKLLFIVSPIACAGVIFFLNRIDPDDIDHAAARGLVSDAGGNKEGYIPPRDESPDISAPPEPPVTGAPGTTSNKNLRTQPSFNFGWQSITGSAMSSATVTPKAETPLKVLRDPVLLTFVLIVFLFHTSNGTVLPLVMQTLAIGSGRTGILMSGLCIIVAQICMVVSAKVCGEYSGKYGRKSLFLVGLFSVPVRCLILSLLLHITNGDDMSTFMRFIVLSTQILDGIGAGIFGTMYILVTSDISGGTGRFSMTLGLTTAAMSIGGTVSGYLGEALAEDIGYKEAFFILMFMALVPALMYLLFMPETLPEFSKDNAEGSGVASNKNTISSIEEEPATADGDQPEPKAKYTELV